MRRADALAAHSRSGRIWRDTGGAAAAEFVLWLSMLTLPVLNVIDLSFYATQRMLLESSARAAVGAAWHNCNTTTLLPTVNCASGKLAAVMQTAAQSSTSLGTTVTMPAASIVEGYYCSNGAGALVLVGTLGSTTAAPAAPNPNNCSSVIKNSTTVPGEYIQATASHTFTVAIASASLASLLPNPITRTAWLRLDK